MRKDFYRTSFFEKGRTEKGNPLSSFFLPLLLFIAFSLQGETPGEAGRAWLVPDRMEAPDPAVSGRETLQERFDLARFRRALARFAYLRSLADELRKEIGTLRNSLSLLDYSSLWKLEESRQRIEKNAARVRRIYRQKMAVELDQVLASLDEIETERIRQDPAVITLYRITYRMLAIFLTESGEYAGATNALDLYLHFEGGEDEWPLHYFYAVNLDALFEGARSNRSIQEKDLRALRIRKNEHLLRFVELRYGRDSFPYRTVSENIRLEELGSPR